MTAPYQDGGDELPGQYQDLLLTLRVLAKSLGFLEALPYATGEPLSKELAEVTGIAPPPASLPSYRRPCLCAPARQCWTSGRTWPRRQLGAGCSSPFPGPSSCSASWTRSPSPCPPTSAIVKLLLDMGYDINAQIETNRSQLGMENYSEKVLNMLHRWVDSLSSCFMRIIPGWTSTDSTQRR